MSLTGICVLGAVLLALAMVFCAILAVLATYEEEECRLRLDDVRAVWQEREALRLMRARYASGKVGPEEFKELILELEESLPR